MRHICDIETIELTKSGLHVQDSREAEQSVTLTGSLVCFGPALWLSKYSLLSKDMTITSHASSCFYTWHNLETTDKIRLGIQLYFFSVDAVHSWPKNFDLMFR